MKDSHSLLWSSFIKFLQFSTHPGYLGVCGKLQKLRQIAPGGLWKRPRNFNPGTWFWQYVFSLYIAVLMQPNGPQCIIKVYILTSWLLNFDDLIWLNFVTPCHKVNVVFSHSLATIGAIVYNASISAHTAFLHTPAATFSHVVISNGVWHGGGA